MKLNRPALLTLSHQLIIINNTELDPIFYWQVINEEFSINIDRKKRRRRVKRKQYQIQQQHPSTETDQSDSDNITQDKRAKKEEITRDLIDIFDVTPGLVDLVLSE